MVLCVLHLQGQTMVSQQALDEIRQEILQEQLDDYNLEQRLRSDLDFALEYLNIGTIDDEITNLLKRLRHYGWDLSRSELLDYLM